jgi:predicted ATPase
MRIRKISIAEWRNFRNLQIDIDQESSLVCLVGANGTGKTHILELISSCAHRVGLSSGVDIPRGDPFNDEVKDFELQFFLAPGVSDALDVPFGTPDVYATWDRTLTIRGVDHALIAGGVSDNHANDFGNQIVNQLRLSKDVHHLTLDADRAFPKQDMPAHEMAQTFEPYWHDDNWNKSRAFTTTRSLYSEWIKYCLAIENKAANRFYQAARRSNEDGTQAPEFSDAFASYRASLRQVMPHLLFAGADQSKKALLFDTSNMELRFDQLSGGEREIAFLVGQIDRFGLRNGIFLIDEPELHLNPDLVRSWVTYLANTVAEGQVWLATHSLEAVEAAGQNSTILLERDPETKQVDRVVSIFERPMLSALSRAVGTPAFSISTLRFVFIEGEEAIGERERYRRVTGLGPDTRFIECGSCGEVIRRLTAIKSLAAASDQPIRIAGVIDRDWRGNAEIEKLKEEHGLICLPVHEVENFFIEPTTLQVIAERNGIEGFDPVDAIRSASDERAGGWILQSAISDDGASDISDLPAEAKSFAHSLTWNTIENDAEGSVRGIVERSGLEGDLAAKLSQRLSVFLRIYKRKRSEATLWKHVEGKEISQRVAARVGFSNTLSLERAVAKQWVERAPSIIRTLREELRGL